MWQPGQSAEIKLVITSTSSFLDQMLDFNLEDVFSIILLQGFCQEKMNTGKRKKLQVDGIEAGVYTDQSSSRFLNLECCRS